MRRFSLLLLALALILPAAAKGFADGESVNYRVMYKWGLINKQAGTVNITTRPAAAGRFDALLTAKSAKWADSFYEVRDTLMGTLNSLTLEPSYYEKITHEGGKYKRDHIVYTRTGGTTTGLCTRWRQDKKKKLTQSQITLTATGLTLDMLSAYYYMRSLDYSAMQPGDTRSLTVFSGKRKETLTICYHGRTDIEIDKNHYDTYHITFRFTQEGKKKSSDDMDAWLWADRDNLPIKLEGSLTVGKVQCYYIF